MDGARLSRFPHLSWLRFAVSSDGAASNPLVWESSGVCHTLSLTVEGHCDVRWIAGGGEARWREEPGSVRLLPADGRPHTFVMAMSPDFRSAFLLLPRGHLSGILESERLVGLPGGRLLDPADGVVRSCIDRLTAGDGPIDTPLDEHARRLVLRLVQLSGGSGPDWYDDASVFERGLLADLVDRIDGRLQSPQAPAELAAHVGLSPSHFARKFRQSTGVSLQRFVNRRRVAAAVPLLESSGAPIATVAEHLGFDSQSHFTRVFRGMSGFTPARFRGQFWRA